jgi:death-on-curing protein
VRYLILAEIYKLHRRAPKEHGGSDGVRDRGAVESAIAQPQMTFGGDELYPTLADKAAALGFSPIKNHPFIDGNKRVGHAAIETFLVLNGCELIGDVNEHERIILAVASGTMPREEFTE